MTLIRINSDQKFLRVGKLYLEYKGTIHSTIVRRALILCFLFLVKSITIGSLCQLVINLHRYRRWLHFQSKLSTEVGLKWSQVIYEEKDSFNDMLLQLIIYCTKQNYPQKPLALFPMGSNVSVYRKRCRIVYVCMWEEIPLNMENQCKAGLD